MEDNTPRLTTAELIEKSHNIFTTTENVVCQMKLGDRLAVKKIAAQVGTTLNLTATQVFPYVNDFCHCTTLGYTSAGKFGGFIRSDTGRPLKTAKPVKTSTITPSPINSENDSESDTDTSNINS